MARRIVKTLTVTEHLKNTVRPLDLTRTKAALKEYDRIGEEFDANVCQENSDRLDAQRLVLADAFAKDTADRNDYQTVYEHVLCLAGLNFIRRLVATIGNP